MDMRKIAIDVRACIGMAGILGALCFGMAGGTAACGALQGGAERPECSDARLAEIEAAYITDVLVVCDGQHYDDCMETPSGKALKARYDRLREEWVECK